MENTVNVPIVIGINIFLFFRLLKKFENILNKLINLKPKYIKICNFDE